MSVFAERGVSPAPRTIGLYVNPHKPRAVEDAERTCSFLDASGVHVRYPRTGELKGEKHPQINEEELEGSDMIVVLGGDGTLLSASRYAAPRKIPMLSVRYGGFGFLAEVEPEELEWALDRVTTGSFKLDKRMMIAS